MHPRQINEVKDKGNQAWVEGDMATALTHYMWGLKLAEIYDNDTRDKLDFKNNFGKLRKLQDGEMFQ